MQLMKHTSELPGQKWAIGFFIFFAIAPVFLSSGTLSLLNEIVILALAASALNLILGYAGMVSFGGAGPYAVGAYVTAVLITKGGVPFGLALIAGPVASLVTGFIIGWFCIRRRHIYFAMLTLAFSQIIYTIIFKWYSFTGGDDGIKGIVVPAYLNSVVLYYYFSLLIAAVCFYAMWRIVHSPFGKSMQAIRENSDRAEFIGLDIMRHRLFAFVLSSFFLGVAGSLFCGFNKHVFPAYAHWLKSTDMLVVCLLGGMYQFEGPIIGSIVYMLLDNSITRITEYWPIVLGVIITSLVLFLPGGVIGFVHDWFYQRREKREIEE